MRAREACAGEPREASEIAYEYALTAEELHKRRALAVVHGDENK